MGKWFFTFFFRSRPIYHVHIGKMISHDINVKSDFLEYYVCMYFCGVKPGKTDYRRDLQFYMPSVSRDCR
jgi:hypothetical protein